MLTLKRNTIPPVNPDPSPLFYHPDYKHHEKGEPTFHFTEERPFFNVYSVANYTSNTTIPPTHNSRRSDYADAQKPQKLHWQPLSMMTKEELAIINAVNLDDYPKLEYDRAFRRLTNLYKAGYIGGEFSLKTYQKWYAYFSQH